MNLEYRFHTLQEQRRVKVKIKTSGKISDLLLSGQTGRERERERVLKENGKRARERERKRERERRERMTGV